jgi:regulator of sirC expression with transglutaminase-like and TPR domain
MMNDLPDEVIEKISSFLIGDGRALGRLSLCSRDLYQRVALDSPALWKKAVELRWSISSVAENEEARDELVREDPRSCYIRRYVLDQEASQLLDEMAADLKCILRLDDNDEAERLDGRYYVGQAWDHIVWTRLLEMGGDIMDGLRKQARKWIPSLDMQHSFDDRLRGFLAARSLQALQLAECLYEWKLLLELEVYHSNQSSTCRRGDQGDIYTAKMIERYALLVNEIQQTPCQLILRRDVSVKTSVLKALDELAEGCRVRIRRGGSSRTIDKIHAVNDYLFQDQGFRGNTDDYNNYRNSLLDQVLETKKGIPITLAILYISVCWRLDVPVGLIGLPGHVVACFWTEKGEKHFVDVFHQGKSLDVNDCRRISESYNVPFQERLLDPLTPNHVLQRILNNLANCHFHGMAHGSDLFHSDLFFHQRALASIHRQPQGIAGPLVDRITKELPLTLSPDLLRYFGLLSSPQSRASAALTSS